MILASDACFYQFFMQVMKQKFRKCIYTQTAQNMPFHIGEHVILGFIADICWTFATNAAKLLCLGNDKDVNKLDFNYADYPITHTVCALELVSI